MKSFLVVSKEPEALRVLRSCFSADYSIESVDGKESALETLKRRRYDVIFIDIEILQGSSPGGGYNESLEEFWHLFQTIQVIVMCSQEGIREAVKAVKWGYRLHCLPPLCRRGKTHN